MNPFFARHKTRKATASLLAIWLSGFVLLFCCGAMETRAETEFCPLTKAKSHCDKTSAAKSGDDVSVIDANLSFECCGFLPAVFDKTRKIEKTPQVSPVNQLKIETPRFSSAEKRFEFAALYRPPEFTQKKIFIKNCVFRI